MSTTVHPIDSAAGHSGHATQKLIAGSGPFSPGDQCATDTHVDRVAGGPDTAADHLPRDTQRGIDGSGPFSPGDQTCVDTQKAHAAGGPDSAAGQIDRDTHDEVTGSGPNSLGDHASCDGHSRSVAGGSDTAADPTCSDTHRTVVGSGPFSPGDQTVSDTQTGRAAGGPILADPLLALAADVLDDLERVRIANENRLRQLTRAAVDTDGVERGFGLDEAHPDVARLAALVAELVKAEHTAELNLKRMMRSHPLGAWVSRTKGVGEKQAARLLAAIGDPYWNDLHDRPRLVSELWSFAGYGDAAQQVRRRGVKSNWSADAKMRAYLVSVSCVKTSGPYREVYDQARARYAEAVHDNACVRCGPSGHPAAAGSPLSAGHQHARAVRAMSKEILRDLWREAKAIHDAGGQVAA